MYNTVPAWKGFTQCNGNKILETLHKIKMEKRAKTVVLGLYSGGEENYDSGVLVRYPERLAEEEYLRESSHLSTGGGK